MVGLKKEQKWRKKAETETEALPTIYASPRRKVANSALARHGNFNENASKVFKSSS
jgi:hypothetical protein